MPPALERCVADLKKRGTGESSAYAICTASLQRVGKMPRAKKKIIASAFAAWAKQVSLPEVLSEGMQKTYPDIEPVDLALIGQLQKVELTDKEGILGLARLHSKVVKISDGGLKRLGDQPIWYGAVLLHEAMHAIHGFYEHEATQIEQRFAGKHFGVGKMEAARGAMEEAIRVASVAQAQRQLQVHSTARKYDERFLTDVGFTPRVSRKVLSIGVSMADRMRQDEVVQRLAREFGFTTKQFLTDIPPEVSDWITKTAKVEVERLLFAALGSDVILKELKHDVSYYLPVESAQLDAAYAATFEWAVAEAARRGVGASLRGPLGVVPKLRRAGYAVDSLPEGERHARDAEVSGMVAQAVEDGFFRQDGTLTDTHLMMAMHGFSPVWGKLTKDALDAEKEIDSERDGD